MPVLYAASLMFDVLFLTRRRSRGGGACGSDLVGRFFSPQTSPTVVQKRHLNYGITVRGVVTFPPPHRDPSASETGLALPL